MYVFYALRIDAENMEIVNFLYCCVFLCPLCNFFYPNPILKIANSKTWSFCRPRNHPHRIKYIHLTNIKNTISLIILNHPLKQNTPLDL